MKKPLIGILPLVDEERDSLWMLPGYMESIKEAGGLSVMLESTDDHDSIDQYIDLCDGFLFTGGQDVAPYIYHEEVLFDSVEPCKARDDMELYLLEKALKKDIPILGICRGLQFINAATGGTLYQDLNNQHPSMITHRMKAPYDVIKHYVDIQKESPLYDILQVERLGVNSCHHQAIKELSPEFKEMAISEDGLIEAIYHPGKKFVWAVQWHPEFSYKVDQNSKKIVKAFVDAINITNSHKPKNF